MSISTLGKTNEQRVRRKRSMNEDEEKEYQQFRDTMHMLMDNIKEKELYEKVTKPKPINTSDIVRISARREGDRVDITLSFTKEYLRKILGER
jgi:hypothetical protein